MKTVELMLRDCVCVLQTYILCMYVYMGIYIIHTSSYYNMYLWLHLIITHYTHWLYVSLFMSCNSLFLFILYGYYPSSYDH